MTESEKPEVLSEFEKLLEEHKPNRLNTDDVDEITKIVTDEKLDEEGYNEKVREVIEKIINDKNYKDLIPFEIKAALVDYHIKNSDKEKAIKCVAETIPAKDTISMLLLYHSILIKEKDRLGATRLLFNRKDIDTILETNDFTDKAYTIKTCLSCVQKEIENVVSDADNKFNSMEKTMLDEDKGEEDIKTVKKGIEENKKEKAFNILRKMSGFLNKIDGRFPELVEKKDENGKNIFMKFEDEVTSMLGIGFAELPEELMKAFIKKGDEFNLLCFLASKSHESFTKEQEEEQLNIMKDYYGSVKNINNTTILLKYPILLIKSKNIRDEEIAEELGYFKDKIVEIRQQNNGKLLNIREFNRFFGDIGRNASIDRIEKHKDILEEIRKLVGYDKSMETILEERRNSSKTKDTDRVSKYCNSNNSGVRIPFS